MKKLKSLMLVVCLVTIGSLASCSPKVGETTGDAALRQTKTTGKILAAALDEGIRQEANFAAAGDIDPLIEPGLKQALKDAKKATDDFNTRAADYVHFDTKSKADIVQFADDAVGFIDKMNTDGVLRIKNPKSQAIASGIIAGAKVAVEILKSQVDSTAAELVPAPAA